MRAPCHEPHRGGLQPRLGSVGTGRHPTVTGVGREPSMGTFAGKLPPRAGARCPGQPTAYKVDHSSPPRWRCDRDATLSRRRPASPSGFKLGCAPAAPGRRGSPWGGCAQLELEPGPAAGVALWPRGAQPAVAPGSRPRNRQKSDGPTPRNPPGRISPLNSHLAGKIAGSSSQLGRAGKRPGEARYTQKLPKTAHDRATSGESGRPKPASVAGSELELPPT